MFFVLNSAEHEIETAHNESSGIFLRQSFIQLIHVEMLVGISTFISRINLIFS